MKRQTILALTLAVLVNAWQTHAYEIPTHGELSSVASDKSMLADQSVLRNLGLDATQKFPTTQGEDSEEFINCKHGESYLIGELIACGAQFEDVPSNRSTNHFFDPAHGGAPLTVLLRDPTGLVGPVPAGMPSPDWVLEDNIEVSEQDFAYRDARDYFYKALTSLLLPDREANWGKLFQTLGQIIHHLQDMAQPQHVRNDAHCDAPLPCLIPGIYLSDEAFRPSKYEKYSRLPLVMDGNIKPLAASADGNSIYPGPGNAYVSLFDTPRKFFIGAGKGIAEYTNANFVSEGTNFKYENGVAGANPDFSQPTSGQAVPYTVLELFLPNGVPPFFRYACGIDPADCYMDFYHTNGEDPLTGQAFTNTRASSLSIFDFDLERFADGTGVFQIAPLTGDSYVTKKIFTLNRFNFDAAHQFLIPRAVAYSAGLINYFFRGKLEISLPDEGIYALADHSLPEVNTKDTGGFSKIKLKLRNITPGGNGVEPTGTTGKLQAVAKFHRNNCYEGITLQGQPGGPLYQDNCRSADEEIVVSAKANATTDLDSESGQAITFTFQSPIPINATDVYLQVVYRGPLGQESDAVVVATKDISEPTFFNFDNYSDCYLVDEIIDFGGYVYHRYGYAQVVGTPLTAAARFNGSNISPVGVNNLAPGSYSRIALLTDNYVASFSDGSNEFSFETMVNQRIGVPDNVVNPALFRKGRPVTNDGNIYGGHGYGDYDTLYVYNSDTGLYDAYLGAQGCTAINPEPQPLAVVFE
jgi:hypothetical protein